MTEYCSICKSELEPDEASICKNCIDSILVNKDIPP